jgi:hypothetical protein
VSALASFVLSFIVWGAIFGTLAVLLTPRRYR